MALLLCSYLAGNNTASVAWNINERQCFFDRFHSRDVKRGHSHISISAGSNFWICYMQLLKRAKNT